MFWRKEIELKNQKLLLGVGIGFSLLILTAAWFYVQHVIPENAFPYSGGVGLAKLLSTVLGIGLVGGLAVFLILKIILPPISGMSFKEYLLRPDERTLRLRYQAGAYVLSFISFYFIVVRSFCRTGNPICNAELGIELMFWGYLGFMVFGVALIFRFLEKRS